MMKPIRVLLIEDSVDDSLLLLRQLRKEGYDPDHERVDTREGLDDAMQKTWDVLLADWSLPAFSGLEALRRVREMSDVPFIIVSGTISGEAAVAAMKAGANDYVPKDDLRRLVPAIERELRDAEERQARKRAEAAADQALAALQASQELDRLKTQFVNAVSHELRTPLTSIIGYAEFLEDHVGGPLTSEQEEFVRQIQWASSRLEALVDDLLDYARIQAGTFKLKLEQADLGLKTKEVVDSMQPLAEQAGISLELSVPDFPLWSYFDPGRIAQVFTNLIHNAIKFTPEGGKIQVRAFIQSDRVVGEVEDTGLGIRPEDLPKLFKPFSQLPNGSNRGGTGLGLSICKTLVETHGGTIGARSTPGKGSLFWFSLPRNHASGSNEEEHRYLADAPGGGMQGNSDGASGNTLQAGSSSQRPWVAKTRPANPFGLRILSSGG